MGRPSRQTFIKFGVNVNASADICQFGTPATGTPVYTNVIATLQALSAWTTGWAAETVANNRPFLEDMNAVCYVFSYFIDYLLVLGIPEYDGGTTYYANSVVQSGGIVYQVFNDNSGAGIIGVVPTNTTYWSTLQMSAQLGVWTSLSTNTIYQATTDLDVTVSVTLLQSQYLQFLTDSSASPSTARTETTEGNQGGSSFTGCITCPVRKGDYFLINTNGTLAYAYSIATGK